MFIFVGEEAGNERVIIFACEEDLELLANTDALYVDGTFDHLPSHVKQLYTIHGNVRGQPVPLVYCWLPNKKEETYNKVFEVLVHNKVCILQKGSILEHGSGYFHCSEQNS